MSTRSLNKVMLIGNLTRDPELRYTPSGTPVCSFGLATNRSWVASGSSDRQEETEFHNIVAWSKLAELCAQLLAKGRKVYIEGRLQTRSWETSAGEKRVKTEIVAEDMIVLDYKYKDAKPSTESKNTDATSAPSSDVSVSTETQEKTKESQESEKSEKKTSTESQTTEGEQSTESSTNEDATPQKEEAKEEAKEDIDLDKIPF